MFNISTLFPNEDLYTGLPPPPPPLWIFPSSKWCTCCSKIPNLIKRDYFYLKCSKSRTNRKSGISQYYLPDSTKTMHDNELLRTDRIFNNMYNNKSYLKISLVLRVATCGEFNEKNVQLICTLYTWLCLCGKPVLKDLKLARVSVSVVCQPYPELQ